MHMFDPMWNNLSQWHLWLSFFYLYCVQTYKFSCRSSHFLFRLNHPVGSSNQCARFLSLWLLKTSVFYNSLARPCVVHYQSENLCHSITVSLFQHHKARNRLPCHQQNRVSAKKSHSSMGHTLSSAPLTYHCYLCVRKLYLWGFKFFAFPRRFFVDIVERSFVLLVNKEDDF